MFRRNRHPQRAYTSDAKTYIYRKVINVNIKVNCKGKAKVHPRTGHEGPEVE
jgi:hypothetical protein